MNEPVDLHSEFDATVWAREFNNLFTIEGVEDQDGLMLGWFANAIMAGYDHAKREAQNVDDATEGQVKP